jgi:hypothetical protein
LEIDNWKLQIETTGFSANLQFAMINLQFAIPTKKGLEREARDPDNNRDRESPRPRIPLSLTIALFGEGLVASSELSTF